MKTLAVIAGVGARTSVGLSAMHTGFLLRAGCAGMMEAPLIDSTEESITACFMPTIDPLLVGAPRATELAVSAMREALAPIADIIAPLRTKLILCVDEQLARAPGNGAGGGGGAGDVLAAVHAEARKMVPSISAEVCARGSAGAGFVLSDALGSLGGSLDAILLGGVHTDYDPEVIRALDAAGRVYRSDNLDALIPGEAAAFVLLTKRELLRTVGLRAYGQIHSVATAFEKATPDNDESAFEAVGLTVAVKKAGAPLLESKLTAGWILTDFTFELFRIYEWQSVSVRARKLFCEPHHLDSPAQRIGHLGAASMPLHLALAAEAWRRGYAPHRFAMSLAGSDGGERAAILMSELQGS